MHMLKLRKLRPIYLYGIGVIPLALMLPFLKSSVGNPATFAIAMIYFFVVRYLAIRFGRKSRDSGLQNDI